MSFAIQSIRTYARNALDNLNRRSLTRSRFTLKTTPRCDSQCEQRRIVKNRYLSFHATCYLTASHGALPVKPRRARSFYLQTLEQFPHPRQPYHSLGVLKQ